MLIETQSSCQILCVLGDLRPKSHLYLHGQGRQTQRATLCRQSGELPARQSLSNTFSLCLLVSIAARACIPVSYNPQDLRESSCSLGKENIDDRWGLRGEDCSHFFTTDEVTTKEFLMQSYWFFETGYYGFSSPVRDGCGSWRECIICSVRSLQKRKRRWQPLSFTSCDFATWT